MNATTVSNSNLPVAVATKSNTNRVSPLYHGNAVPWHGLGMTIETPFLKTETAFHQLGIDWEVGMDTCHMPDGTVIPSGRVLYRKDTRQVFDIVGTRYKIKNNVDAFSWVDQFISSGGVSVESAGTLKDHRIVWVLAKTNIAPVEIETGDVVAYYMFLSHSHDGTLGVRVGFLPVRMNNWSFLSQDRNLISNTIVNVKHTEVVKLDVEAVGTVMQNAQTDFLHTTTQYKKMAKHKMTKQMALAYFTEAFTGEKGEKNITDTLDKLIFLFENGINVNNMTLWGAYTAICELNTWYRGRGTDTRMQSVMITGAYKESNTKALEVANLFLK